MKKSLQTIMLLTTLAFPSYANAEEKKEIPENLQRKYDRRTEDMKAFDKNKDGILQAEELQGSQAVKFDAADLNKDGTLSSEEVKASIESRKVANEEKYGEAM